MRVITATGLDALDDVETYTIRDTVRAVRCDDGVTITDDKGDTLQSAPGDVVLVIDGTDYTPIPADIFDALYAGSSTPASSAAPTPPTSSSTPTTTTAADEESTEPTGQDETTEGEQPTPSVQGLSQP